MGAIPQINDVLHHLSNNLPITHADATVRNAVEAEAQCLQNTQTGSPNASNPSDCMQAQVHTCNQRDAGVPGTRQEFGFSANSNFRQTTASLQCPCSISHHRGICPPPAPKKIYNITAVVCSYGTEKIEHPKTTTNIKHGTNTEGSNIACPQSLQNSKNHHPMQHS